MEKRLSSYNAFCSTLHEGDILKNLNTSNGWGEFLLVAGKSMVSDTYSVLLMGLERNEGVFMGNGNSIYLNPDKLEHTSYLRYVGAGKFSFRPVVYDVKLDERLMNVCGRLNVRKVGRKPRTKKYDSAGNPIIKRTNNN